MDDSEGYRLTSPASRRLVTEAMDAAKRVFGTHALSVDDIQKWIDVNPFVLAVLTNSDRFAGYLDVLPLTPAGLIEVKTPTVTERDWDARHILSPDAMQTASDLYVASLLVVDRASSAGHENARALFRALAGYLETLYGNQPRHGWGLAATADGFRVLNRWGATKVQDGAERSDGMTLFRFSLEPNLIREILVKDGSKAPRVSLHLDRP